jgi:hypothetical protein
MKALLLRVNTTHQERWNRISDPLFSAPSSRRILPRMAPANSVPDASTLTGGHESRLAQLLRIVQRRPRVAQRAASPRMREVSIGLEDVIADQLAALGDATKDDRAEADATTGAAEQGRQSWRPLRTA